ncbi:NAD(P)H-quinone oxidoreductase [Citromicrobium sp. JLT1363]|uniref:NAD(P)H-quinone oxidoreductase n=1 Tax=Citromicrobium sp. JLT1363 TaxID=517722 RepID=UPI000225ECC5|nr:NAD(P)H-quinone oxidoreductase [Citromicrobium sp. JLT1363]
MRATGYAETGGPEVLGLREDAAVPRPGAGEVLLKVAYAGVNRPDCIQRAGHYPPPPGASPILGLEASGEIVAVGEGVDVSWLGEQVCALTPGGAYAEYCVVPEGHMLPVPDVLTMAEAAALPETLFTVWHNVFQRGMARDGEMLLVHGGTSGIGTMAIMLAKAFGLGVIVTAGSEEKCDAARAVGADHAIDYKTTDFVEAVGLITGGDGVDVVLDMVSGDYVSRNLKCLKPDGRHVTIAVLGGLKAQINMALVMSKRLVLTGSTLRPRSDAFKTALRDEIAREAWPLVEDGTIRPVMDEIFALADADKAHARMENGDHIGKIVLAIDEDLSRSGLSSDR